MLKNEVLRQISKRKRTERHKLNSSTPDKTNIKFTKKSINIITFVLFIYNQFLVYETICSIINIINECYMCKCTGTFFQRLC
jgi:hypothetical protein